MSARKPPSADIRATEAPAALPLTKAEQAMLLSFRAMDDVGRRQIELLANGVARRHPRQPLPALRLIVGGAT